MKKRVDIYPRSPILRIVPPIRVPYHNTIRDVDFIKNCIMDGAEVYEILKNGKRIRLTLNNYNKDNNVTEENTVKITSNEKPSIENKEPDNDSQKNEEINLPTDDSTLTDIESSYDDAVLDEEDTDNDDTEIEEDAEDGFIETIDVDSIV